MCCLNFEFVIWGPIWGLRLETGSPHSRFFRRWSPIRSCAGSKLESASGDALTDR
jgi:hypothetical protein